MATKKKSAAFKKGLYSGTSNLVLPVRKEHYPAAFKDKSRLEYYSSLFQSLEVNSSFYKTPKAATVAKWAAMVPENFRLTFKLSKAVTHAKGLQFNEDDIKHFMQSIAPAAERKGCLLIQFPPSVTIDKIDRLQQLLADVSFYNEAGWKLAIEFRHASWYERETYEILQEHKATVVIHDIPSSATPPGAPVTAAAYVRYHGPGGKYRGSYSDEFLSAEAEKIRKLLKQKKDVYCYFNNTMGDALKNLQTLNGFLL